jgi:mannose-6-phosphate isomerase
MDSLYPLRLTEIFKEKIWGGRNIADLFNKPLPPAALIGESWEVSDRENDQSVVAEGPLKGVSLHELVTRYGDRLVGTCPLAKGRFPLLFKILDAHSTLSVQVHPTDQLALEYDEPDPGKTEMWYVLAAQKAAQIMLGLQPGIGKVEFQEAIRTGAFEKCLNYFEAKPGDAFFLPAGSVHALGAGIVLVEIQENSDLTYRVYDWGRVGAGGKPRELHLDKALRATNFESSSMGRASGVTLTDGQNRRTVLTACRYFATEILELSGAHSVKGTGRTFTILFFEQGNARLAWEGGELAVSKGQSVLVPAEVVAWSVDGKGRFLKFYVPDLVSDIIEPLMNAGVTQQDIRILGGDPDTGDVATALAGLKGQPHA